MGNKNTGCCHGRLLHSGSHHMAKRHIQFPNDYHGRGSVKHTVEVASSEFHLAAAGQIDRILVPEPSKKAARLPFTSDIGSLPLACDRSPSTTTAFLLFNHDEHHHCHHHYHLLLRLSCPDIVGRSCCSANYVANIRQQRGVPQSNGGSPTRRRKLHVFTILFLSDKSRTTDVTDSTLHCVKLAAVEGTLRRPVSRVLYMHVPSAVTLLLSWRKWIVPWLHQLLLYC